MINLTIIAIYVSDLETMRNVLVPNALGRLFQHDLSEALCSLRSLFNTRIFSLSFSLKRPLETTLSLFLQVFLSFFSSVCLLLSLQSPSQTIISYLDSLAPRFQVTVVQARNLDAKDSDGTRYRVHCHPTMPFY